MSRPRVIFMGTPAFAVPTVHALAETELCDLVAVVTRQDKPAGRGRKLMPPPVKVAASEHGVPVLQPTKLKKTETHEALRGYRPDLAVVAAYGRILPKAVLDIPRLGCVNVHASLLPRHRGASPIAHAILAGDAESGVSIMLMDEGLDTGPVLRSDAIPLDPDITCGGLTDRLATLGADSLLRALPGILDGSSTAVAQEDSGATYAPLLKKEDGALDFAAPAVELERRVRAFDPWPGTFTHAGDLTVRVWRAHVVHGNGGPGTVLAASGEGVIVACGSDALQLDEVQPAGRKRMAAAAWVAGRGVTTGDRLGR
jgi:methionyl-tRNA formyltransferase